MVLSSKESGSNKADSHPSIAGYHLVVGILLPSGLAVFCRGLACIAIVTELAPTSVVLM